VTTNGAAFRIIKGWHKIIMFTIIHVIVGANKSVVIIATARAGGRTHATIIFVIRVMANWAILSHIDSFQGDPSIFVTRQNNHVVWHSG
jgi:hypothetical protein